MPLKTGAQVRQITPAPIQGAVADARYDAEAGVMHYLVQWTDADGNVSARWFTETEIQEVAQ